MTHLPSDLTTLAAVGSWVKTPKASITNEDWCALECARIGPKASIRYVEQNGQRFCCVNVQGLNIKDGSE